MLWVRSASQVGAWVGVPGGVLRPYQALVGMVELLQDFIHDGIGQVGHD